MEEHKKGTTENVFCGEILRLVKSEEIYAKIADRNELYEAVQRMIPEGHIGKRKIFTESSSFSQVYQTQKIAPIGRITQSRRVHTGSIIDRIRKKAKDFCATFLAKV